MGTTLAQGRGLSPAVVARNADIEHMLVRHASGTAPRAGKFSSTSDIPQLIKDALDFGAVQLASAGRSNHLVFELPFVSAIGTKSGGGEAYSIRVIILKGGYFISAFPF